jgi:peptidoglycan/xylan/chitin deacetylase (PgdA/CDA1 family)
MHAVFFVYTGAVGPQPGGPYLSWPQLRALEAAGHEVQSHTVGHPHLTQLPPDRLAAELRDSKARIVSELHHPADVLAYPYGDHDDDVMDATLAAGYRLAVRADDDPAIGEPLRFRLPRVRMGYGDGIEVFAERMEAGTPHDAGPAAGPGAAAAP